MGARIAGADRRARGARIVRRQLDAREARWRL